MTIKLSAFGGGGLARLAPDLTRWQQSQVTASVDVTAALGTVLSLTGKRSISLLQLSSMSVNDLTDVKLTIDGVVITNVSGITVNAATENIIGSTTAAQEMFECRTSLLLEAKMTADTAIVAVYVTRLIL